MSNVVFCADIGSCHGGELERAKEAIRVASEIGLDFIKFQLFPPQKKYIEAGNIPLYYEFWPELNEYAFGKVGLITSVFDERGLWTAQREHPAFIKFAYSQKHRTDWMTAVGPEKCIVSCDLLTRKDVPEEAMTLYCIPQYPVPFVVDFDGLFDKFDGFSDHTMGVEQTFRAIGNGAMFIEKHMRLDTEVGCPDEAFAVTPKQMEEIVRYGK